MKEAGKKITIGSKGSNVNNDSCEWNLLQISLLLAFYHHNLKKTLTKATFIKKKWDKSKLFKWKIDVFNMTIQLCELEFLFYNAYLQL